MGIQSIGQFVHYGQRLGPVVSVHRIGDIHGDQQINLHFALTGGFLKLTNQITADIGADGRGKIGKIGFQKGFPLRIHCRREGQGEYWKNHQDFGEPADQEGKSQHDKQHAEEENTEKVFASFQTVGIDSGAQYQQIHSICRQSDCGSGGNRFQPARAVVFPAGENQNESGYQKYGHNSKQEDPIEIQKCPCKTLTG